MNRTTIILAAATLSAGMCAAPVTAAGLLGNGDGLLGTDIGSGSSGGGLFGGGGVDTGNTLDVDSGPAGSDAFANAGIGNGGGANDNIADVKLGRGDPAASATVKGGLFGNGGLLGTGLGAGGSGLGGQNGLTAGLNLGGLGLGGLTGGNDLTLNIGGGGAGGSGGSGGTGGTGGPGPGVVVPGGGGGGLAGGGSRVADLGNSGAACSLPEGRQVLQTAANAKVSNSAIARWQRAYNVQVVPVKLCASTRSQVAKILNQSGKINMLQNAAASDALISTSLSRSRYDANDVFAVESHNGQLVVYVF